MWRRRAMHAKNRIPSSGHNSPSPPQSPLSRSPRLRRKQGRFSPSGQPGPRTFPQRVAWFFLSGLLRRQGIFLFAPLLYISGMLFYMGTVSFDVVPVIHHRSAPGSVYRSPQLYAKLRPEMESDNSSADAVSWLSCGKPIWDLLLSWIIFAFFLYLISYFFFFVIVGFFLFSDFISDNVGCYWNW